jgi:hypothetical protein
MQLRARVGRHFKTGKNCQNWKSDQEKVIALLNKAQISDGGAQGMITAPVVGGMASQQLFTAILYFQDKNFPENVTGFFEPTGSPLAHLERIAAKPAPPKIAQSPLWDNLKSGSVERAMRRGMVGDNKLDNDEVVDIIRATLQNGIVSKSELDDIKNVATQAKSISPWSRELLNKFYDQITSAAGSRGPYSLPSDGHKYAANTICDFLKRFGTTFFPKLSRNEVGVGLLARVANPGIIRQGYSSLCGPVALLFNVASDSPAGYAKFAIDLFEKGQAKIGRLEIKPGSDARNYLPPEFVTVDGKRKQVNVHQADWLTMASIRDSENFLLDYDSVEDEVAGATTAGGLAQWFRLAGYRDVADHTSLIDHGSITYKTIEQANSLLDKGHRVVLMINGQLLDAAEQTTAGTILDRHWVVLRKPIDRSGGNIKATVFTWGEGEYKIPQGAPLSESDFFKNFFGFVSAKP